MSIILYLAGILMLIATLLPLTKYKIWWVRNLDFPRLQIFFITLVVFTLFLLVNNLNHAVDILFACTLLVIMIYQAIKIFPYTFLFKKQVPDQTTHNLISELSILTVNVQKDNRHSAPCIQMIKENQPDILILLEVDSWWAEQLKSMQNLYEYQVSYPQENPYGMVLFSKFKLINPSVEFIIQDDIPSIHTDVQDNQGHLIRLICVHPAPPTPPLIDGERNDSKERDYELLKVARQLESWDGPAIVAGDLNDVAWSKTTQTFQYVSGLLDPRQGRGFFNSFHAKHPFLRFPLDHIFVSEHFLCEDIKRLGSIDSDHFPIYIKLGLKKK